MGFSEIVKNGTATVNKEGTHEKKNIILIGMPGVGKSTVGVVLKSDGIPVHWMPIW